MNGLRSVWRLSKIHSFPFLINTVTMADTLKDVPEFFENELGESITARTDALGNFIISAALIFSMLY